MLTFVIVNFWSYSPISVTFIWSYSFGQVNNPHIKTTKGDFCIDVRYLNLILSSSPEKMKAKVKDKQTDKLFEGLCPSVKTRVPKIITDCAEILQTKLPERQN